MCIRDSAFSVRVPYLYYSNIPEVDRSRYGTRFPETCFLCVCALVLRQTVFLTSSCLDKLYNDKKNTKSSLPMKNIKKIHFLTWARLELLEYLQGPSFKRQYSTRIYTHVYNFVAYISFQGIPVYLGKLEFSIKVITSLPIGLHTTFLSFFMMICVILFQTDLYLIHYYSFTFVTWLSWRQLGI